VGGPEHSLEHRQMGDELLEREIGAPGASAVGTSAVASSAEHR
jgi:hypothetical protein